MERQKINDELTELLKTIEQLRAILESEQELMDLVVSELQTISASHGDERRTEIVEAAGDFRVEDLIAEEDMAITVSNTGYIKRTALTEYRNQRRGGKGRLGMRTRDEDFLTQLFVASTHAYILIFSDRGRVYWLKVHEIPDVGPAGKGKAIANLVRMAPDERIATLQAVRHWPENDGEQFVTMGTKRGIVKKTDLRAYRRPLASGIIAMSVASGDAVIGAELTDGKEELFIGTRAGKAIRFKEADVRAMGRTARGVRGITLRGNDEVVAMTVVKPSGMLLTVTARGYGKRTELGEYRVQTRGGLGLKNIQTSERNGRVTGVAYVEQDDEMMLITEQGKIIRMVTGDIRPIGRVTQGVRLIEIDEDDRVVSLARLAEKDLSDKADDDGDQPPPEERAD